MKKFQTENMTDKEADALVAFALPLMNESGRIPWAEVEAAGVDTCGYSRGWLIVRHAWLTKHQPSSITPAAALVAAAEKKAAAAGKLQDFTEFKVLNPIIQDMRDGKKLSWGEIAVRLEIPESKVRKNYRRGVKKDLGLRIGRGGRFAYDDPTLYRANRKAEGAHIPADLKPKPKETDLLNYVPEKGTKKQVVKSSGKPKQAKAKQTAA